MATEGANMKRCVTCAMYDGPRIPKVNIVEYDQSSCGKCYVRIPQGTPVKPNCLCAEWVKWPALR